jgi:hypothetical protein
MDIGISGVGGNKLSNGVKMINMGWYMVISKVLMYLLMQFSRNIDELCWIIISKAMMNLVPR